MTYDTKYIPEKSQSVPTQRHQSERWEVKKLNDKYRAIARLLAAGRSQTEIAREMGMSIPHVNRIANSPLIVEEVHRIQDEMGMALVERQIRELLQ